MSEMTPTDDNDEIKYDPKLMDYADAPPDDDDAEKVPWLRKLAAKLRRGSDPDRPA